MYNFEDISENGLEQRARRAARRIGLLARKSRWRAHTVDNRGGFMLVNPRTSYPVKGLRFDLSAEDVIRFCDSRRAEAA
jgi:hypothetical protein